MRPWSCRTVVLTGRDISSLSLSPPCQDTAGRQSSTSQGDSSHQKPTLLASRSWIPSPQNCKKIKFCCLSPLRSVAQLCLTLQPGSSVHGISQARILEGVAISFSRGFFQPRDQTRLSCISCTGRQILYHWAAWEACGILTWRPSWLRQVASWTPGVRSVLRPLSQCLSPSQREPSSSAHCNAWPAQEHLRNTTGGYEVKLSKGV